VPVRVSYVTDPACVWSWASEPALRRLRVEFGADLRFTYVMGGLDREIGPDHGYVAKWIQAAGRTGMLVDPLLWEEGPLRSTYPACMAVKAAHEQDWDESYLRLLREGILCRRRKLDGTEALVEVAREAGLDVERFRIDLGSNAIVEAFAGDLEAARAVPEECREEGRITCSESKERVPFPTLGFTGEDGETRWLAGYRDYDEYRSAAVGAGAVPSGEWLEVPEALERFGTMAAKEVAAVCDLPDPRAHAELWRLVLDWKARPVPVLAGHLFEPA
jgi:predicted DsbA family dithiol-disulfide isomerase